MLAVIYYVVPKETRTPLYSHFLSLIAFWGIIFFYTGVGAHHLLWAPIPYWLKTIAVAESIGMILPVVAFIRGTMDRSHHRLLLLSGRAVPASLLLGKCKDSEGEGG